MSNTFNLRRTNHSARFCSILDFGFGFGFGFAFALRIILISSLVLTHLC